MKRLLAILRCLWHALQPPTLERLLTGSVHYRPQWTWREHCRVNLREAWRLAAMVEMDEESRRFHRVGDP